MDTAPGPEPGPVAVTPSIVPLPEFRVSMPDGPPSRVRVARLRRYPQHLAAVAFVCATSGPRHHRFRGPLLHDVLCDETPLVAEGARRSRARFLIRIHGRDGHRAVLSWAEIDPEFTATPFLLATELDGAALGAAGPQLVSPSDACGARYISAIDDIGVVRG